MCNATDVAGQQWSGPLDVAGQNEQRTLSLTLHGGSGKDIAHRGKSSLLVGNPVTDGTYSFTEYVASDSNAQPFGIELQGLGAAPTTLVLTIRGPAKSPVFAEPAMVGLCAAANVKPGSPFVPATESKETPR